MPPQAPVEQADVLLDAALDVLEETDEPSDTDLAQETGTDEAAGPDVAPGVSTTGVLSSDALGSYLAGIARIPLLTAKQEVDLGGRIHAGTAARTELHLAGEGAEALAPETEARLRRTVADGRAAAEEMTRANLRLVVSVAKRYTASGLPLLDLVQEGNIGLMKAVERFDPQRGFKFSTYATWWIRQGCRAGVATTSRLVRVPTDVHWQLQSLRRAEAEPTDSHGNRLTDDELATRLGVTVARVEQLRRLGPQPISLDLPLGTDGEGTLQDVLVDDEVVPLADQVVDAQLRPVLRRVLAALPERDRRIVEMRYGLTGGRAHTLEEVARELSVSRQRIRQVESRVFSRLRRHPEVAGLRDR